MNIKTVLLRLFQYVTLTVLFAIIYAGSSMPLAPYMPSMALSEPGPIPSPLDMLVVCAVQALVVMTILLSSSGYGWKLALLIGFSYYGINTFMADIEAWYFLEDLTLPPGLLPRMFAAGLATAFIFVPLAVIVLWKIRKPGAAATQQDAHMPASQWAWKLAVLVPVYLLLYFGAGYFIAWQNPELRAFYHGADAANFFQAMVNNWQNDPGLFSFQAVRSLLWVLFALPVARMTRGNLLWKALVVGLWLGVPFNIGHIMANPLIPLASVRLSHMIETASSTFIYGMIITWLLHRRHTSLADLFGMHPAGTARQPAAASISQG